MSRATNGVTPPSDEGERTRRRQYRITARLLKEYTARLYRIANHLGSHLDGHVPKDQDGSLAHSVITAVWRYKSIWDEVRDAALFASQMLVHYDLDEAEAAELRVRIKDAERAVQRTGSLVNLAITRDPNPLGKAIPTDELNDVLKQSKSALKS